MKKIIISCLVVSFLFSAYNAKAQKASKKFSFGFGLEAGLVTGIEKEAYSFSPGITIRGSYKVGPGFATLTTGGIIYVPKDFDDDDLKASLRIPVKAGYKYIFNDHFFVMGEIGFSSFRSYFEDLNGDLQSISSSGFTYAPAIGVQTGTFEVSVRYEATSLPGSTLSGAFVRLGFNF